MNTSNFLLRGLDWFGTYSDIIGLTIIFITLLFTYQSLRCSLKSWILFFYSLFWISTLITTISNFLHLTNNWMYNSMPFLLSIPLYFFFFSVHDSRILRWFNVLFIISFMLVAIIFWKQIFIKNFNPIFYLTFSFYILINSVGYLYEEMTTMRSDNLFKKTEFWFVSCLFFYATICVITWSLFSYLEDNIAAQNRFLHPGTLWMYGHNNILFIQSLVFSTAIFKTASKK